MDEAVVPRAEDTWMLRALLDGATYEAVGIEYGLSKERVRQRMMDRGWRETIDIERERRAAQAKAEAELAARNPKPVRTLSIDHGGTLGRTEWPDEAIIAAVRRWMDEGGSGKAQDFPGPPSTALITQRIGWHQALTLAGYEPGFRYRRHRVDRLSDQDLLAAMVEFLSDPDTRLGSTREYEDWAPTHGGPSVTTIRVRFGSWVDAKALALTRMPAERSI